MTIVRTPELGAILDYLSTGNGHLLINALAGTGKTTALLEALSIIPQQTALLCAFNKPIADELASKILLRKRKGHVFAAQTFHSAGLRVLNKRKRITIDKHATDGLITDACLLADGKMALDFKARRAATKLLRLCKETYSGAEVFVEPARALGVAFDCFVEFSDPEVINNIIYCVQRAYDLGLNIDQRDKIDFCDMVWLPVVLDLVPPSRYQAIFVDEMQDLSLLQWEMVKQLLAPKGRIVGVGDLHQQVYGWRGSIGPKIWDDLRSMGAIELPLNTTFRCPPEIVREAQQLVPQLRALDSKPHGSVETIQFDELVDRLTWDVDTFVLSRTNADLLEVALHLFENDVQFHLAGGDEIMGPLIAIIQKLDKSTLQRFKASLVTWFNAEMMKADAMGSSALADKVEQQFGMLCCVMNFSTDPSDYLQILNNLAGETMRVSAVTLSTAHKVKGREADRVFLLRQSFHRHQEWRKEPVEPEEFNIEYVAITRAKQALYWVNMPDGLSAAARAMQSSLMAEAERLRMIATAKTPREQMSFLEGRSEYTYDPDADEEL